MPCQKFIVKILRKQLWYTSIIRRCATSPLTKATIRSCT